MTSLLLCRLHFASCPRAWQFSCLRLWKKKKQEVSHRCSFVSCVFGTQAVWPMPSIWKGSALVGWASHTLDGCAIFSIVTDRTNKALRGVDIWPSIKDKNVNMQNQIATVIGLNSVDTGWLHLKAFPATTNSSTLNNHPLSFSIQKCCLKNWQIGQDQKQIKTI